MTSLITPVAARPSSAVPPCTPRALRALRYIATRASSAVQPAAPTTLVDPAALNGLPATDAACGVAPAPTASAAPAVFDGPLTVGVASKIGPRSQNDDFAGFGRNHEIFAVADGIGGAPRGDVAATVAVNAAVSAFEGEGSLVEAMTCANAAVMQLCEWLASPETGSTLLLAARDAEERDRLNFAWAGDSSAFLLHAGTLSLLTEPERHPGGNALLSAVGYLPELTPRITTARIAEGDRVLLCTDGVWETLDPVRLAELLSEGDNAPWIAETIAREAAERGSDNATALVLIARGTAGPEAGEGRQTDGRDSLAARIPRVPLTPSCPASDYRDRARPPASVEAIAALYGLELERDLTALSEIDVD